LKIRRCDFHINLVNCNKFELLPIGVIAMLHVEVEREDDGRWIAEVVDLPGVLAYGQSREQAVERAKALSLRVMADRLEHGEAIPEMGDVFAVQP
jgi:predicted RNase H-like HicB family nuclease